VTWLTLVVPRVLVQRSKLAVSHAAVAGSFTRLAIERT
jgi:hypothetical protein